MKHTLQTVTREDVITATERADLTTAVMLIVIARLRQHNGNRTQTAKSLGIDRRRLCRWIAEWKSKRRVAAGLVKVEPKYQTTTRTATVLAYQPGPPV